MSTATLAAAHDERILPLAELVILLPRLRKRAMLGHRCGVGNQLLGEVEAYSLDRLLYGRVIPDAAEYVRATSKPYSPPWIVYVWLLVALSKDVTSLQAKTRTDESVATTSFKLISAMTLRPRAQRAAVSPLTL